MDEMENHNLFVHDQWTMNCGEEGIEAFAAQLYLLTSLLTQFDKYINGDGGSRAVGNTLSVRV